MHNLTLEDVEELLLIDKNSLDDEVEMQSATSSCVGKRMVEIESIRDAAKEALSIVDACIANEIREKVEKKNEKITEAKLNHQVLLDDRHKDAMYGYLESKKEAAFWKIKREDFLGRAFMISQMCGLHESEYFERTSVKINNVKMKIRDDLIKEKSGQRRRITRDVE